MKTLKLLLAVIILASTIQSCCTVPVPDEAKEGIEAYE